MAVTTIDKKSINISIGLAIVVVLFLIGMTANFASWKSEMESAHIEFDDRITHVGEKVVDMRAELVTLQNKASQRDIELATISTKLTNIEALLIDLKQQIKEHDIN